ncbi:MAG: protein kinase [Myxococcales bacterium]|nr:protein kinase [Myxococcales bacterium]
MRVTPNTPLGQQTDAPLEARDGLSGAEGLPREGERFGPYRIVRELGRGGMGAVFEVEHTGLQKRMALKVMLASVGRDHHLRERFVREGRAAARVQHAHIVDVTDVGELDGVPYLVMEFLEGESLASRLNREGPLSPEAIAQVMVPVCAALSAAHDAGVVHRDLKPENIFLARGRRNEATPKLVDFGISRLVASEGEELKRLTGTEMILGTPAYLAPEQTRGARYVDAFSDQYSLGVVMFELATGRLPFDAETMLGMLQEILTAPTPHIAAVSPEIDARFDAVVFKAMQRDRSARHRDMRALGNALLPFLSEAGRQRWESEFPMPIEAAPTWRPPAAAPIPREALHETVEAAAVAPRVEVARDVAPAPSAARGPELTRPAPWLVLVSAVATVALVALVWRLVSPARAAPTVAASPVSQRTAPPPQVPTLPPAPAVLRPVETPREVPVAPPAETPLAAPARRSQRPAEGRAHGHTATGPATPQPTVPQPATTTASTAPTAPPPSTPPPSGSPSWQQVRSTF